MNKQIVIAAAVANGILLASGFGYRVLSAQLARPTESTPLPPGVLAKFPLRLGHWEGRDVPVDEAIRKATDADDLLNRVYTLREGTGAVGFYLAYGIRSRDLMPHRPEVCYPGNGWTLQDSDEEKIALPDGSDLRCRIYRFIRSGLEVGNITVLNYYLVDGQCSPDVSRLRTKAWRGSGGIRYMAQVQITGSRSLGMSSEAVRASVRRFAAESALAVRDLFPKELTNTPSGNVYEK